MADIPSREITPPDVYFNRRNFLRGGIVAAGAVGSGLLYRRINQVEIVESTSAQLPGLVKATAAPYITPPDPNKPAGGLEDLTPELKVTNYNNFYEFTTDKDGVAEAAAGFDTSAGSVEVSGLVRQAADVRPRPTCAGSRRPRSGSTGSAASRRGRW
jgi:sulfoxide reductase catalytic subunit YedY